MGDNPSAKLKIVLASSGYGGSLHDDALDFFQVGFGGIRFRLQANDARVVAFETILCVHCMSRRSMVMMWR